MSVHSRGLPELCLEYFWLHGKVTMLIKAKNIIDIVVIFIIYLSVTI